MDYAELFNIIERHAEPRDLLFDFDIHLVHHDEYYPLSIKDGRKKPRNLYMVSINDSYVGDSFAGVDCSHLDFNYDVRRNFIRDVDIWLLDSSEGQGYGRKLVEVMEGVAVDLGCRGIVVGDVTNHGFWRHFGYKKVKNKRNEKIYRVKGFGFTELEGAAQLTFAPGSTTPSA